MSPEKLKIESIFEKSSSLEGLNDRSENEQDVSGNPCVTGCDIGCDNACDKGCDAGCDEGCDHGCDRDQD